MSVQLVWWWYEFRGRTKVGAGIKGKTPDN